MFREIFSRVLCLVLFARLDQHAPSSRIAPLGQNVYFPDEIFDIIMQFMGKRLLLNRGPIVRNFCRGMSKYQINAEYAANLALPADGGLFDMQTKFYLVSDNLEAYISAGHEHLGILSLSQLLGPLGWILWLRMHSKLDLREYLASLERLLHVLKSNGVPLVQLRELSDAAIHDIFGTVPDAFDTLSRLQVPEYLFSPLYVESSELLLQFAQSTHTSTHVSAEFKQWVSLCLMCLPEGREADIISGLTGELQYVSLYQPFPLRVNISESDRAVIYSRNLEIINGLIAARIANGRSAAQLRRLNRENTVRFGNISSILTLGHEDVLAIMGSFVIGLTFIWGRDSVRTAWGVVLNHLGRSGHQYFLNLIVFDPRRLNSISANSWCLHTVTIQIVYSCICEPAVTESLLCRHFIEMWYEAMAEIRTAFFIPLEPVKTICCILKAYSMAERQGNVACMENLVNLYLAYEKHYFEIAVAEVEPCFLEPTFMMRLYGSRPIGSCHLLRKIILAYCFGIDHRHIHLLKLFIHQDPGTMAHELQRAVAGLRLPARAYMSHLDLFNYSVSVASTVQGCCFKLKK